MTDATERCEPPEGLRHSREWHWLAQYGSTELAPYLWNAHQQGWHDMGAIVTPADAAHAHGYRYIAPCLQPETPATVTALEADRDDWKRLCFIAEPEAAAMKLEIQRLRAIVRVNGLRHGATHAEVDAVLAGDAPELTGSLAPKTQTDDSA